MALLRGQINPLPSGDSESSSLHFPVKKVSTSFRPDRGTPLNLPTGRLGSPFLLYLLFLPFESVPPAPFCSCPLTSIVTESSSSYNTKTKIFRMRLLLTHCIVLIPFELRGFWPNLKFDGGGFLSEISSIYLPCRPLVFFLSTDESGC